MRKAILIGAPGTIESKNFLEGVEINFNHFEFFYNIFLEDIYSITSPNSTLP